MVVTTARLDRKSAKFTQYRKTISDDINQPIAPRLDHVSLVWNVSSTAAKSSYWMPLRDGGYSQGSLRGLRSIDPYTTKKSTIPGRIMAMAIRGATQNHAAVAVKRT